MHLVPNKMFLSTAEKPIKKYSTSFEPLKVISYNPDREKQLDTSIPPPMLNESLDSANSNSSEKLQYSEAEQADLSENRSFDNDVRRNSLPQVNNYEEFEVKGPEGQVCESKNVLDSILTKYTHISSNTFKG